MKMSEEKQLELFEDNRDKDISSIDRLFRDVKRYRKSSEFKKKLDFYCGFPYLGVYNAALVEQQRPGARLVLTTKKWEELYNRRIKLKKVKNDSVRGQVSNICFMTKVIQYALTHSPQGDTVLQSYVTDSPLLLHVSCGQVLGKPFPR